MVTLDEIATQLRAVARRLSAIEAKLGVETPPALARVRELEAELARLRREKEQAIEAQDFERSAGLRDQEKQLLTRYKQAEQDWLNEAEPPSPGAETA
jgi:protein-arginine kinase activator protein McsA